MFKTSDIAAACGVDRATVRSWLSRSPGFQVGTLENGARQFDRVEALALVITGETLSRQLGTPSEVLPIAALIAGGSPDRTVWLYRKDGRLTFSEWQPDVPAVAMPLSALDARL